MISTKRFVQMAKKWQRIAALARKRLTPSKLAEETEESCCTSMSVAGKGHCVLYSVDGRRFEVPSVYLGSAAMEYMMCFLRKGASKEVERAFLSSLPVCECPDNFLGVANMLQFLVSED